MINLRLVFFGLTHFCRRFPSLFQIAVARPEAPCESDLARALAKYQQGRGKMAKKTTPTDAKLQGAMRGMHQQLRNRPNLTGVDIGYEWADGKQTTRKCVRVHLAQKLPEAAVPEYEMIPREFGGVRIDVLEGNYRLPEESAAQPQTKAALPFLMGGLSISRAAGGAGTLGAIVKDRQTQRPGILSNWHVLAGAQAQAGDVIFHPALLDAASSPPRQVAYLTRFVLSHLGDAAFATLSGHLPWIPLQFGSFSRVTSVRRSRLGETLSKHGRTSGTTKGKVDGEGIYRVEYETRPGHLEARDIEGFRLVAPRPDNPLDLEISAPGDSGATWINENENAGVGLHFAGETSPLAEHEFALACNLDTVLEALDVELATREDVQNAAEEMVAPELTPRPDDPWWPPRWPPIGPRPGWPPVPPKWPLVPPRPRWSQWDTFPGAQFDGVRTVRGVSTESNLAELVEVRRLLGVLIDALRQHGFNVDNLTGNSSVMKIVVTAQGGIATAENAIAWVMNTYAPHELRRIITGAELENNGDGSLGGASVVIYQINKGIIQ